MTAEALQALRVRVYIRLERGTYKAYNESGELIAQSPYRSEVEQAIKTYLLLKSGHITALQKDTPNPNQ